MLASLFCNEQVPCQSFSSNRSIFTSDLDISKQIVCQTFCHPLVNEVGAVVISVLWVSVDVIYLSQRRDKNRLDPYLYSRIGVDIGRKRDRQIGIRLAIVALRYVNLALDRQG